MGPLRQAVCHSVWTSPSLLTRRWPLRPYSTIPAGPVPVASVTCTEQDGLGTVLEDAYRAEQPLIVRKDQAVASRSGVILPAADRWFVGLDSANGAEEPPAAATASARLAPYLEQRFSMVQLPYELMYWPLAPARLAAAAAGAVGDGGEGDPRTALVGFLSWLASRDSGDSTSESSVGADDTLAVRHSLAALLVHHLSAATAQQTPPPQDSSSNESSSAHSPAQLLRFHAPLGLLMAALAYNHSLAAAAAAAAAGSTPSAHPVRQLYIAQASLDDLPTALQDDLPVPPPLVRRSRPRSAGGAIRGDIYASSLWLGLEPTYTPWHRDPNPNLFGQLCSRKTVRLMPPAAGERLFRAVQTELARATSRPSTTAAAVHARIRGEEMMQGPERAALHQAVWGRAEEDGAETAPPAAASPTGMHEAHLGPGDLLFIPKGWWHSVKSAHADGRLNGSVNWWFR